MKVKRLKSGQIVVRLFRGENPVTALTEFAEKYRFGGSVMGIGALDWVEIGHFHLKRGDYAKKQYERELELLSLMGNISFLDGKPFAHLHAMLADDDLFTFGGHLFNGRVSATCEIVITPWEKDDVVRTLDDVTRLNLWNI